MWLTFWVHESGRIGCGSNYGFFGRWENFFNLDLHEDMITKLFMWIFRFGGSDDCKIFLYCWCFSLRWCHHNLDWGECQEGSSGLMCSNFNAFREIFPSKLLFDLICMNELMCVLQVKIMCYHWCSVFPNKGSTPSHDFCQFIF
jgi:hypothetical protein